jgi:putative ABC transport system permease protein
MSRWAQFFGRRKRMMEALDDDIRDFIERETQDNIERGMPPTEARYAALRKFGNATQVKEETWELWSFLWLEQLWQDIRYGARQLRRNPGFTIVAVVTLALGIGANTAVFSLVDEIWLRPRPVPHPERVVRIFTSSPTSGSAIAEGESSYLDYYYISRAVNAFSGVAFLQRRGSLLYTHGDAKLLNSAVISDDFFDVLEPKAVAGHVLTAQQAGEPGALAVMLSYPFWNDQFNADPALLGKTIILDGQHVTVTGILPRGFRGTDPTDTPAVWIPWSTWSELTGERATLATGWSNPSDLFGRLAPRATLQQAKAQLAVIATRLAREHPDTNAGRKMMCRPESQVQGEGVRGYSLILLAISGSVLLIACANVASLIIARGERRRHEFAMQSALGGSRRRLLRQLLTEAAVLGAAATAAAVAVGGWVDRLLPAVLPTMAFTTPIDAHLTARVLWFSVGAGLFSVFAFGAIPARRGSRTSLSEVLKQQARSATSRASVRSLLVAAQVAISMVLVVAAGLLVRSLMNVEVANPGFDAHQNMLFADFAADFKTPEAYRASVEEVRRSIEAIPGVVGTAIAMRIPFGLSGSGATRKVFVAGATGRAATDGIPIRYDPVSDNFFQMMGTRILRGRAIEAHDLQTGAHVMVINQMMAQRFWPRQDPIGQYVRLGKPDSDQYEVIGIAENCVNQDFLEPPEPYFYTPMGLGDYGELEMVVKTAPDPAGLASVVRRTLLGLGHQVGIIYFKTLREHVRLAMTDERISAELIASLGMLGLLLAAVGLYGLTAYLVGSRTQEIGIRMALGAQKSDVLWAVIGQGLNLVSIGLPFGVAGALAITRFLSSLLYGVKPTDPLTFVAVTVILAAVALVACYVPARRATKVDPMVALRYE